MDVSDSVLFVDLKAQHESIRRELEIAFERVMREVAFTLGGEVSAFEREFADFLGTGDAVGVGSGTDALHFALRACGVGEGDEVITAVNTFAATAEAILMCGARPVFVDIDPDTYLMDVNALEDAVGPRTRAIVPVHLYGQVVDMLAVRRVADAHDLRVVEDACQAHGAMSAGVKAGAAGDAGCFSFYPSKNLGAMGDGGMVVTNDPGIADRVRSLRNHGEDIRRLHTEPGYCSRLHGMQAAMLRTKLPLLPRWNERRVTTARTYIEALAPQPVTLPFIAPGADHVFHLFVIGTPERDALRAHLEAAGIQTGIHYPLPLHLEPAFAELGYRPGEFPVAERAAEEILSLPMHPFMSEPQVARVSSAIGTYFDG